MARDFWMTKRLAVKIDKIKKSLTIPAASYNCGPVNQSLYMPSTTSALYTGGTPFAIGSFTTVSIDFYLRQFDNPTSNNYIICQLISSIGPRIMSLKNNGGFLRLEVVTSGGTFVVNTTRPIPFHSWTRYTLTFSSVTNLARLYINTELVASVVTAGNLSVDDYILAFGDSPVQSFVIGYIQDVALYIKELTQEDVIQIGTHRGNVGVYGANLAAYWKLRQNFDPTVGAVPDLETADPLSEFTDDQVAPIKFGASFVVAQTDIALDSKCSLRFPSTPPEGTTGAFVVRWEDDNGVIQRRKLWEQTGVDLVAAVYSGEPVSANFTLEFWNIDGEDTAVIPEDIVFRVSKTTHPTTSYDTTPVAAATVTMDSTLASNFPMAFPIVFNTQQVYSS